MRLGRWSTAAVALMTLVAGALGASTSAAHTGEQPSGWFLYGAPGTQWLLDPEQAHLVGGHHIELRADTPDQQRIRARISDGIGHRGVVHAGGRLIAGGEAPTGETRSTGYMAGEPTFGIFKDGTLVYE